MLRGITDTSDIDRTWREGIKPDPLLSLREWADENGWISTREGAEPGPYRTSRTPYWREPMECLSVTHPSMTVVVRKGAQLGFTKMGTLWIGYIMQHVPAPTMVVQPTVNLAKRYSRQRLNPLIEDTPAIIGLVRESRQRDSGNTQLSKEFPGGEILLTGANSAVELRSFTARNLFFDEVDAYPIDVDAEGDPILLADKRSETFGVRRKRLIGSTPNLNGLSRIDDFIDLSDYRRYFVPCPLCGKKQPLEFERLHWDEGHPETAMYFCVHCKEGFKEHYKPAMLDGGEWRATRKPKDDSIVGFDINQLYSPLGWSTWAGIARQWEEAIGKTQKLKVFYNTVCGRSFQEQGEAPDWMRLHDRLEGYMIGTVPWGGLFLTAGCDMQRDRAEIDVYAWGRDMESWLVEHIVVNGDPSKKEFWAQIDGILQKVWYHESGLPMKIQRFAIDTGDGTSTNTIYQWTAQADRRLVMAIKGTPGFNKAQPINGPSKVTVKLPDGRAIRRGAELYTVTVDVFKSETVRLLNLQHPTNEQLEKGVPYPDGYVHLPSGVSDEWLQQMCAERLETIRNRRGFTVRAWRQLRDRNEAFDCRVYARAAAWAEGMDFWHAKRWEKLEAQFPSRPIPQASTEQIVDQRSLPSHDPQTGEIIEPKERIASKPVGVLRKKPNYRRVVSRSNYMR